MTTGVPAMPMFRQKVMGQQAVVHLRAAGCRQHCLPGGSLGLLRTVVDTRSSEVFPVAPKAKTPPSSLQLFLLRIREAGNALEDNAILD